MKADVVIGFEELGTEEMCNEMKRLRQTGRLAAIVWVPNLEVCVTP